MGVFDDMYKFNGWGFGSGHGSLPSVTKGYRRFIETFMKENHIKSVVDYGCGDWQFSKLINWDNVAYTGIDVVPSLIEQNKERYGSEKIQFKAIKPGDSKQLPRADLIIVKDVLQHLPHKDVEAFIKNALPKYKYALITNCILPTEDINIDIETGGFRPLDIRKKPFKADAKVVYTFTGPKAFSWQQKKFFPAWKKLVLLVG